VPSQFFTSNPVQVNYQGQNLWAKDVTMPTSYQTYPQAPPTTPSMSGSDSLNGAPTPLILDGSDFSSPYASGGQLHSSNFFGSGLGQYSRMPMSYSPEPMFPASFGSKDDFGYLQRLNNEQLYGSSGFTSCPSVQITDLQNKSYQPGYQWNNLMTPQYHPDTMPPSRPSSADSSRYGTSI